MFTIADRDGKPIKLASNKTDEGEHVLQIAGGGQGGSGDSLTDEELRASPVPVAVDFPDTQQVSGPITNEQLRAAAVPVSVDFPATQPVSGPLTNEQLRAAAVPVSGPLTDDQLAAILGRATVDAWDGAPGSATAIAILKALHAAITVLSPAKAAVVVTPSNSQDLVTPTRAIWVGAGGDISLQVNDQTVIHKNVPAGSRLDVAATRVNATGTTAGDIVAWS